MVNGCFKTGVHQIEQLRALLPDEGLAQQEVTEPDVGT